LPDANHPIRSNITAGSVYYYNDPELGSAYSHFCIVVNIDPSKDTVIFLVYPSSRIDRVRNRRKGYPAETLVEITSAQYSEFGKKSIIDCNVILERSIDALVNRHKQGKLIIKPVMDLRLIKILRRGLMASNQIADRIKSLLKD
jgi:hypothetical protein